MLRAFAVCIVGIVSLPQELQRLLGSLRDLDDRTAELMAGAREKVQKLLHLSSQSGKKAQDGEAKKIEALRRDVEERYELVTQWSHEKVRLAVLAYEMIDINMVNLDRDILKFQEELAAQNSLPPDLSGLEKGLMAGDLSYEMMQQQQAASLQASIRPPKVSRGKDVKRKSSVRSEKVDPFKHLQIDDNVAARISPPSAEADEWIVCKVIGMSDDKHYFDLLDEHAGEDEINTHRLTRLNVIPLPKPDSRHAIQTFPPGTYVLAIFPGTTAFYRAAVVATPKRQKSALVGDYLLEFDDDIEDGIIMQRAVSIDQVVALPFDFKLG